MKHIESLLNNDWVTPPMQKNKKIAKKLKYFTFQKYFDKLDSISNEKEKKELFNNIHNLYKCNYSNRINIIGKSTQFIHIFPCHFYNYFEYPILPGFPNL